MARFFPNLLKKNNNTVNSQTQASQQKENHSKACPLKLVNINEKEKILKVAR